MKLRVGIVGLGLSLLANVAFAGAVYVWTENGVKHYSDQKPEGVKSEQLQVMTGAPAPSTGGNNAAAQEQPPASTDNATASAGDEAKTQKDAQDKIRKQNCDTAKRNLDVLNTYRRIKVTENGKTRYLTPEEMSAKKQQFEKLEKDYCGEPAAQ